MYIEDQSGLSRDGSRDSSGPISQGGGDRQSEGSELFGDQDVQDTHEDHDCQESLENHEDKKTVHLALCPILIAANPFSQPSITSPLPILKVKGWPLLLEQSTWGSSSVDSDSQDC